MLSNNIRTVPCQIIIPSHLIRRQNTNHRHPILLWFRVGFQEEEEEEAIIINRNRRIHNRLTISNTRNNRILPRNTILEIRVVQGIPVIAIAGNADIIIIIMVTSSFVNFISILDMRFCICLVSIFITNINIINVGGNVIIDIVDEDQGRHLRRHHPKKKSTIENCHLAFRLGTTIGERVDQKIVVATGSSLYGVLSVSPPNTKHTRC